MTLESKIRSLLEIAIKKVPYYSYLQSYDEYYELTKFPVITRDILSNENVNFINSDYIHDLKQMICLRTSGTSTGHPMEIYWKSDDYIKSSKSIWKYRKKWYDISPFDTYICFHTYMYYGNRVEKNQLYFYHKNYLSLNAHELDDNRLRDYCNLIKKYKPKWIQFIPNIALKFVTYMEKNNINPFESVEYIEYNGETLSDAIRQRVDNFFNVKSANLYGSIETNSIAYECPHHNIVFMNENIWVESINGKIYITNLHNTVMPLIRYDLGDRIELIPNKCSCSNSPFSITKIYGRNTDGIRIGNTFVTESLAGYCIDYANGNLCNSIQQYQFIRKNNMWNLVLYIAPKFNGWQETIKSEIIAIMKIQKIYIKRENIIFVNHEIPYANKKFNVFNY